VRKGYLKMEWNTLRRGHKDGAGRLDGRDVREGGGREAPEEGPWGTRRGRVGVRRVLADGAYGSRANFNFPAGEGMEPVIRVRSGSAPRSGGSPARRQAVMEQRKYRPRAWSGIHGFGSRWRVEGAFSATRR